MASGVQWFRCGRQGASYYLVDSDELGLDGDYRLGCNYMLRMNEEEQQQQQQQHSPWGPASDGLGAQHLPLSVSGACDPQGPPLTIRRTHTVRDWGGL